MNKTAIKNFAVWARKKLIEDTKSRAALLGIRADGIDDPLPQSSNEIEFFDIGLEKPVSLTGKVLSQRRSLVGKITKMAKASDYKTAFNSVIEEVAYTWFNRLIALRFMEVNEYLPSGFRVLSSEEPDRLEPDFVATPFDAGLEFSENERAEIIRLKDENKLTELFRRLLIKQCNELNNALPGLFEHIDDYTELLLSVSYSDREGVVYRLVHDIDEVDWKDAVQIIGWMYQYYISEKHDEIINIYKGTIKKEDIPAATQLFTTDWVVRYMVDNSLGRYWIERNPNCKLAAKLEFFATPKNNEIVYINDPIKPQDLTFFDPCVGSGHILVYAFEVLMEIYKECGYSERDAVVEIITNNLYGLDIDNRASQLAYFAVMMKARSYDRRFLRRCINPNVLTIQESNNLNGFCRAGITPDLKQNATGEYLIDSFRNAKEYGSLINIKPVNFSAFSDYLNECAESGQLSLESAHWMQEELPLVKHLIQQAEILSKKYAVVCTNPPYMNKLESHLKDFVTTEYKPYSGDLFSVFIYRNFGFCKEGGYSAFMTPFVWMFIKTYEKLREYIISEKSITSLIQMEYSAFEEATVPICTFVLKNGRSTNKGIYFKLSDFKGGMEVQKQKVLEALNDKNCGYFYETGAENFSKIPSSRIAYWANEPILHDFVIGTQLSKIAYPRQGMATTNNNTFLRFWFEVSIKTIGFSLNNEEETVGPYKWFPYNKGGDFRKWYGNNEYIVNFKDKGREVCNYIDSHSAVNHTGRVINRDKFFHPSVTWSKISSGNISFRYKPKGFIFDVAGTSIFGETDMMTQLLGLLNSKVIDKVLSCLSPTLNYEVGHICDVPILPNFTEAKILAKPSILENIAQSRTDWDSFETSWDFKTHPLIEYAPDISAGPRAIADAYINYKTACNARFDRLKANEEELNKIFIGIYGLEAELTPAVADRDVTVARIYDDKGQVPESIKGNGYLLTKADVVKSFISYAVGCTFGRYSLDAPGLAFAGGEWNAQKYKSFKPDEDNCVPITDDEYFTDDIVTRFTEFLSAAFGAERLEENLAFIAKALGNAGVTPRKTIREYFLKDFYKDHCKTYKKRPIYWLFDSGNENGFKALFYLHRYNADTIGNMRVEYLRKAQLFYENVISTERQTLKEATDAVEKARVNKRLEKFTKQSRECRQYDEMVAHLALDRITLDLDDGVKANYEKLQTARDGKKYEILGKI